MADIRLPAEILTAVLEEVDVQDLWHVRMASCTLCAVVNPIVFRVLYVTSRESAQKLGWLIDIPDIAVHVRKVTYKGTWEPERGASSSPHPIGHIMTCLCIRGRWVTSPLSVGTPELASPFSELFSRIHQLPRLETINLSFYGVSANSDSGGCPSLQASILAALAASFSAHAPCELMSLSLEYLLMSDFPPLESTPFLTLLTPALRRLHLFVCNDYAPDDARWCNFWRTFFPRVTPAPVQHTLTDLDIRNEIAIGSSSGLSFAGLYFPRLCALSLSNFFWEPSVGIEPFILRHATTLARLELFFCGLPVTSIRLLSPSPSTALVEAKELSTSWEHIWDRFEAELTALVALDPNIMVYAIHDDSNKRVTGIGASETRKAADNAALQRFRATVATRSKVMHRKS